MLLGVVVAQLEGGVAEVPQHVAVVHVLAVRSARSSAATAPAQSPSAAEVMATSICLRQRVRAIVLGGRRGHDVAGGQRGAAVGAVGAHHGRGDGDLQRPDRVDLVDRVGGLDEDPVGVGGRAEVDLDVSPQARDVAEQQRVGRAPRAPPTAGPCAGGLTARPRAAGRRERQIGTLGRVGGQRRRAFVGRQRPRRTRRDAGPASRRARGPRPRPGRGRRRRRRGATPPGRGRRRRPGRRPGPGAPVAAPRPWRPGRPPTAPAGDAPAPTRRRRRAARTPARPPGPARPGRAADAARERRRARRCRRPPPAAAATAPAAAAAGSGRGTTCSTRAVRWSCAGSGDGPPELVRAELGGQLQQRQRVAAVSTMSRSVTSSRGRAAQVRSSRARAASGSRPVSDQLGKPLRVERRPRRPSRAANTMTTRSAPSRRAQNSSASAVAGSSQWASSTTHSTSVLLGRGGQHRQGRHPHQERLDRRPVLLAERHPQRPGLRGGKLVPQPHHRAQQPMQRRERQRRLDLEALGAQHRRVTGVGDHASSRADLPTPGSPRTTRLPADPCRASSTSAARSARSRSRPTSTRRPYSRATPARRQTRRFDRGDPAGPARLEAPVGRDRPAQRPMRSRPHQEAPPWPTTHRPPTATDDPAGDAARHIGLLLFDGVEELDAVGPWEVLAYWTQQHPEDGWNVSCLSADGATVVGAKNLVLGAHHSIDDAPALDVLIHPGGARHPATAPRPRAPGLGPAAAGRGPADDLGVHRQPRLRRRRTADRPARRPRTGRR